MQPFRDVVQAGHWPLKISAYQLLNLAAQAVAVRANLEQFRRIRFQHSRQGGLTLHDGKLQIATVEKKLSRFDANCTALPKTSR